MENDNRENVFEVYNKIAEWFSENRDSGLMEKYYLDKMITLLNREANILDLGCGTGKPILEYLISNKFKVTGVDASLKMIEIASRNFPNVEFIIEDMRKLSINKKFDAIIAWHSFFHLPARDQPKMFNIFSAHLNSRGILLFTSGTEKGEAWGINGGEDLFHASLNTADYQSLLANNEFDLLEHKINDENCGGATVWMAQYNPQ